MSQVNTDQPLRADNDNAPAQERDLGLALPAAPIGDDRFYFAPTAAQEPSAPLDFDLWATESRA